MKLFLKYIGENLRFYPKVKLTKTDEILIRNSVMNHLGLTNLNQLRDRYDGQSFLEKTTRNIGGLIATQKQLNFELIDLKEVNLNDFQPFIELNNQKILINVFPFGELPLVNLKDKNTPTHFVIQKDTLTFLHCGLASKEVIIKNLIDTSIVKSSNDKFMQFTGFKFLEKINN